MLSVSTQFHVKKQTDTCFILASSLYNRIIFGIIFFTLMVAMLLCFDIQKPLSKGFLLGNIIFLLILGISFYQAFFVIQISFRKKEEYLVFAKSFFFLNFRCFNIFKFTYASEKESAKVILKQISLLNQMSLKSQKDHNHRDPTYFYKFYFTISEQQFLLDQSNRTKEINRSAQALADFLDLELCIETY